MNPVPLLSLGLLASGALLLPSTGAAAVHDSLPAAATTWSVDPVHSTVGFRIQHAGASWFHGRFNEMSGSIAYDAAKPEASTIQFEIAASSVDTNSAKRDDHLRGADFFNVKVNPKISFQSTSVKAAGENKLAVKGKLLLHGVEKEIEVAATFTGTGSMQGKELAGFEAEFAVQRSEFGITTYPGALGEEVRIRVSIEAIRQ